MRIPATKPFLPPLEEYEKILKDIWERNWLTNHGPLVQQFEKEISAYLNLEHLTYVDSGTAGLQLVLKHLPGKGEVITTPFSYVATTSSIEWEGFKPVFADIHPETWTIDPDAVLAKINDKTVAILATHIYGNACHIEALETIAKKHQIPLIYDSAHAFGSAYGKKPLVHYGDYSVLSFHATKLFHTISGGLVIAHHHEDEAALDRMRNFGHTGTNSFKGVGINAKVSEFHAAMGIINLRYADEIIRKRKAQWEYYEKRLGMAGFELPKILNKGEQNGNYFSLLAESSEIRETLIQEGSARGIEIRRYFSPSLNRLDYTMGPPCLIAEDIAARVLSLPLYHDMTRQEQDEVIELLRK